MLGTVWNLVSCFFSYLDCCKIGDIYPAIVSSQTPLLKEKPLMFFLFRSKPSNSKKCIFNPSKAFGRLSCSTQNTANCSLNLHSNKYWKTVTLKDRIALLLKKLIFWALWTFLGQSSIWKKLVERFSARTWPLENTKCFTGSIIPRILFPMTAKYHTTSIKVTWKDL